jgi:hypothetical protein
VSMVTYVTNLIAFSVKTNLNLRISCSYKDRILIDAMLFQENCLMVLV